MENNQKPIYASNVVDFITVAADYCIFLEKLDASISQKSFVERMLKVLPLIYVKASLLPDLEREGDEDLPEAVVEDEYNLVQHKVWGVMRAEDNYLEVFSEDLHFSGEPVTASVSEDLTDIYQDLKNFVVIFADDNELNMNNAIVKLKENFQTYWGQKLVNAMRPLHDLLYNHHLDDASQFDYEKDGGELL